MSRPEHRTPGRSLPERTTPALMREAPWFSFNAGTAPRVHEGPPLGPTRFLLGANVPWIHEGLDVGASRWRPEGGLHAHPEDAALLRQVFARLRDDGVHHARMHVLCDARSGVRFGEDGAPEGLDGAALPDLDLVLEAARGVGLGLVLVLLDGRFLASTTLTDGTVVGGHAETLRRPEWRAALLERVLRPLLHRVGDHPAVLAIDVMDSPDRSTLGCVQPTPSAARPASPPSSRAPSAWVRGARRVARALGLGRDAAQPPSWVTADEMRAFLGEAVALVHRHSRALATVGLASTENLELVRGLGLDVYSAAWMPHHGDAALRSAVSDLGLDRPLVLAAFPGRHPHKSIKTVLDTARCAGFGGAFVWSVLEHDGLAGYDGQLAQWAKNHAAHLVRREALVATPRPSGAHAAVDPAQTGQPAIGPGSSPGSQVANGPRTTGPHAVVSAPRPTGSHAAVAQVSAPLPDPDPEARADDEAAPESGRLSAALPG